MIVLRADEDRGTLPLPGKNMQSILINTLRSGLGVGLRGGRVVPLLSIVSFFGPGLSAEAGFAAARRAACG